MSSKSRKQSSSRPVPARAGATAATDEARGHGRHGAFDLPDELVHVPDKTSPMRFVLMVGLVIVLLVIFVIPTALTGAFARSVPGETADFVWESPETGIHELSYLEFQTQHRLFRGPLEFDPFLAAGLGITGRNADREAIARLLVLEQLAAEAGIEISDDDLREHMTTSMRFIGLPPDPEILNQVARRYGTSPLAFQDALRRALRAERYLQLVGFAAQVPDPARIEELWSEEHVELAYDYVAVPVESQEEAARAELPDAEALATWWTEEPDTVRQPLLEPELRRAEYAVFEDLEATPAAALLERYPAPEDRSAEELAQEYYNRVFFNRFQRPPQTAEDGEDAPPAAEEAAEAAEEPEGDAADGEGAAEEEPAAAEGAVQAPEDEAAPEDEGAQDEGAQDEGAQDEGAADEAPADEGAGAAEPEEPAEEPFLRFDEVRERCLAEAPVYRALSDWLSDLQSRVEAGEEVDFAREAQELGLAWSADETSVTRNALAEREELGGPTTSNAVFQTAAGRFAFNVLVDADDFAIVRVAEVEEPKVPTYEEIPERVADLWVAERARTLARERLEAVWNELPVAPREERRAEDEADLFEVEEVAPPEVHLADEASFARAVEAAGLEVGRRDWLDRMGSVLADPDRAEPAHAFLWGRRNELDLDVDRVPEPAFGPGGRVVYLVRVAGKREVDIARMTPQDYERYKLQTANEEMQDLRENFSFAYLQQRYGLELRSDAAGEDEEGAEDEGDDGDEGDEG